MRILVCFIFAIIALILVCFLILSGFALLVRTNKAYCEDSRVYRSVLNGASAAVLWIMRIKVRLSGIEKLPKNQVLLFVGNHRSNFDPIITWYKLRDWNIAYVSKAENFKIPIFGRLIRRCCFLSIDRENPRKAIKTINDAANLLEKQAVSIGVYPEGTRSKNGELLPFHNGVLKIAKKSSVPIAVVTLEGTEKIHKNFPFHRSNIEMNIVDVIPKDRVVSLSSSELATNVRSLVEGALVKR